jgi:hypothetical protein
MMTPLGSAAMIASGPDRTAAAMSRSSITLHHPPLPVIRRSGAGPLGIDVLGELPAGRRHGLPGCSGRRVVDHPLMSFGKRSVVTVVGQDV